MFAFIKEGSSQYIFLCRLAHSMPFCTHAQNRNNAEVPSISWSQSLSRPIRLTKAHIYSIFNLQSDFIKILLSGNHVATIRRISDKKYQKLNEDFCCCCYDFLDSTVKLQRKELLEFPGQMS